MNEAGLCEDCPENTVPSRADPRSCVNDPGQMVALFETAPDWGYYNPDNVDTIRIRAYWETASVSGGPITQPLRTADLTPVKTPLLDLMYSTRSYGYFNINKVQWSIQSSNYFDVWVLATKEEDVAVLSRLAEQDPGLVICCMWDDGIRVHQYLNGFARVIRYQDRANLGSQPEGTYIMWEGEVTDG